MCTYQVCRTFFSSAESFGQGVFYPSICCYGGCSYPKAVTGIELADSGVPVCPILSNFLSEVTPDEESSIFKDSVK